MPVNVFTTIDDPLAALGTEAFGINDAGLIVGQFFDVNTRRHGFLLSGGSFMTLDDPLGTSGSGSVTNGINDAGQVVGTFLNGGHPWLPRERRHFHDHRRSLSPDTFAFGINNAGQIVGSFNDGSGGHHGFFRHTTAGGFVTNDIIDFPSAVQTDAVGINNAGQIAGFYLAGGRHHGFVRRTVAGGFLTFDIIDVPSATNTLALGINDAGQVVGFYTNASGSHGFLLSGGTFFTLDDPSGQPSRGTEVFGINDIGPDRRTLPRCRAAIPTASSW